MNLKFIFPHIYFIITFIILACVIIFLYSKHARINKKFLILRILFLLILAIIFFKPSIVVYQKDERKETVAIALDVSKSMDIGIKGSRLSKCLKVFERDFGEIRKKYNVEYYIFTNKPYHITDTEFFSLINNDPKTLRKNPILKQVKYEGTDIYGSLYKIKEELKNQRLVNIILLSDGRHNLDTSKDVLDELGVAVNSIALSEAKQFKDISVIDVESSYVFFRDVISEIDFKVKSINCKGKSVKIYLKEGEKIVDTKLVKFTHTNQIVPLKFSIKPDREGDVAYTIIAQKIRGEAAYVNNTYIIDGKIYKNKIRVLYLCGRPSWEYAFLRNILKNDPIVDLVSFNILRNPQNISTISERELSLIPFPVNEIFAKEIFNFDLLILENFTYQSLFTKSYLANIERMVVRGGGLIIIGGEKSFSKGGYKNTPIEKLLPVVLDPKTETERLGLFDLEVKSFEHPIMFLGDSIKDCKSIWRSMPKLDGFITVKAKEDADVLAVYQSHPIIITQTKGKGKILCTTNNTFWRLSFNKAKIGKTNYYSEFWTKAIRYITNVSSFKTYNLKLDKNNVVPGEKIKVSLRKFEDTQFDEKPILLVINPNYNVETGQRPVSGDGRSLVKQEIVKFKKIEKGLYETYYVPRYFGKYKLKMISKGQERKEVSDEKYLYVGYRHLEFENVETNVELLRDIAVLTDGNLFFVHIVNFQDILIPASKVLKKFVSVNHIWKSLYFFVIIVLLISIEWFLRRRKGMI